MKDRWRHLLPWIVPVGGLVVWESLSRVGILPSRVLPAPSSVAQSAWHLTLSGELPRHFWESLVRAAAGMAIGGALGFLLGVLNGFSRWAELLFDGSMQMVRNIPNLAMVPLAIVWFGIGESSKLFLIVLGVIFPVYLNTFHGIRAVDPKLIEMARVYGLSRWEVIRHVILPGALPSILVGVRFALGVMWVTLIIAETIAADSGIGYLVNDAREFMQTEIIVLGILLYATLGKGADSFTRLLEGRFLAWHPNHQYRRA